MRPLASPTPEATLPVGMAAAVLQVLVAGSYASTSPHRPQADGVDLAIHSPSRSELCAKHGCCGTPSVGGRTVDSTLTLVVHAVTIRYRARSRLRTESNSVL